MAERGIDGSCIVDVGGVGYEVLVPVRTLGRLPAPPEVATLHVHTHVREDALVLFAFASVEDRAAFRALLGVAGIGPKMALAVLSVLDAPQLAAAVARADKAAFKNIPGIGKKTIERLLIDLKDKVNDLASHGGALPPAIGLPAPVPAGNVGIVVDALVQMGFKPHEAERAVAALPEPEQKPVEKLLREALSALA